MVNDMSVFRDEIDGLDAQIVKLFAERFRVTRQVGLYKKSHNMAAVDPGREAAQFARIEQLAKDAGLDAGFAKRMLRLTIDAAVAGHRAL